VEVESSAQFSTKDFGISGRIQSDHGHMIEGLIAAEDITFKVSCTPNDGPMPRKPPRTSALLPCTLDLTIYGPGTPEFLDEIGSWLQDYDAYLQDPRVCHFDVKYCNPHRLSYIDIESCPMVSAIVSDRPELILREIGERPDLLDTLSSAIDLEEAPKPRAIRAVLKKYAQICHLGRKLTNKKKASKTSFNIHALP
jgi:hypothetical protein